MEIIFWFLPALIFLGIVTSYEDIKKGTIRNKWIIFSLAYAISAYMAISYYSIKAGLTLRTGYFLELIGTALFSLATAFVIWHAGLWTAGDGKLFFAYSILVPLEVYRYGYIPYFSSISILINTFIPVFLFLVFLLIFRTSLKEKIEYGKQALEFNRIMQLLLYLFALIWPIRLLFAFIRLQLNYFLMIFLLFVLMTQAEKTLKLDIRYILGGIAVLRMIFDPSVFTEMAWTELFTFSVLFIVLRFFILPIGFNYFTENVPIKDLKEGMMPAEAILRKKGGYIKIPLVQFSMLSSLRQTSMKNTVLEQTAEGLTRDGIGRMQKMRLPFSSIRVKHTTSFAPFLFAGAFLTIAVQGNFIVLLISLFL
ncbi:hypothetical protein J4212_07625 [Candidatus Woesearchaeota archaeon]|nr:hypothetical protein [Candidatus Woesearchaeota archaeon]